MGSPRQRPAEREGEGGSDGRDPPVSDRVRGEARAQRSRRSSADGSACGPSSWAAHGIVLFSFFFYAVFALYLNLCNKSCADPKIMKIFV